MKTKIIILILLPVLLLSLNSFTNAESIKNISSSEIDTSYNVILESINKTLEKTEETERINSKIKNLKFDNYQYTLHVFCKENNDKQIYTGSIKRLVQIAKGNYNLTKYI